MPGASSAVDLLVDEVDYEGDDRRGLVAIGRRDGQRHTVSLLDVSLADPVDPETAQLLTAYRRWAGADPPPRSLAAGCNRLNPQDANRLRF